MRDSKESTKPESEIEIDWDNAESEAPLDLEAEIERLEYLNYLDETAYPIGYAEQIKRHIGY